MALLYSRDLPGGGIVAIEVTEESAGHHARLVVERRADPRRREGHPPPVVAEMTGTSRDAVYGALYSIASDNVALAQALIRWHATRRQ